MSWSYRIVRHRENVGGKIVEHCSLHEVYYESDGKPISMTENPATFTGDANTDVAASLIRALNDIQMFDVLDADEITKV